MPNELIFTGAVRRVERDKGERAEEEGREIENSKRVREGSILVRVQSHA